MLFLCLLTTKTVLGVGWANGSCLLKDKSAASWLHVCSKLGTSASSYLLLEPPPGNESVLLNTWLANGYLGIHFFQNFSIHFQGLQHSVAGKEGVMIFAKETRLLFAQFGNPAHSPIRILAGRMNQAFGLNHRIHGLYITEKVKSQLYWQGPAFAGRLTLTNHKDLQLDIQASRTDFKDKQTGDLTIAVRISKDLQLFSGTRLLASGLSSAERSQRIGLAMLNQTNFGSLSLEWVRLATSDSTVVSKPKEQLIQLTYTQKAHTFGEWLFEFEQELFRHSLTSLGYRFLFWETSFILFQAVHLRSTNPELVESTWIANIRAQLNL